MPAAVSLVQLVHAVDDGIALSAAALASGFEGVVGKRKASRYESGRRSASWLKVKPVSSADFVVGGYTKGQGSRAPLGALLVGYWGDGELSDKLHYASHVGSGFDERALKQVKARLEPLQRKTNPFAEKPELNAPTTWVEPEVVAEVSFQSWTDDDHLRAPVFLRLRDDIDPKAVRRVAAGPQTDAAAGGPIDDIVAQLAAKKAALTLAVGTHRIKLTNLDRVYWPADPARELPAYTKRDLLTYLAQVSPYMLPHLADRPLTMIRMPDGIRGQRFFQKHWEQERPAFVESITVFSAHKDEQHDYLLCNNLPTLLWLAQSGTLEYHVWHSRARPGPDAVSKGTDYASSLESLEASVLNYPDYVLFDLDPYIYSGKEAKGAEPELNTDRLRERQGSCVLAARASAGHVARAHRQDVGQDGSPRVRSDQAHDRLRCGAACVGVRRPAPDAPASEGHHAGVEHSQADRQDLHGLQHERPRQDAQRRLFAARRARSAGIDAADVGGARGRAPARFHDRERAGAARPDGRPLEGCVAKEAQPGGGIGENHRVTYCKLRKTLTYFPVRTHTPHTREASWLHDR